jgi:hypothetical protein
VSPAEVSAVTQVDSRILLIRGQKVLLDEHLATLYGVELRSLVQAVKRNTERFPDDFLFQLNHQEVAILKSQFVISSSGHGGRRSRPYAFTEQGIAMLSGLLNSPRAIAVNIEIMRTFVRLRQMIAGHADLARKLKAMEKKYDAQFKVVFDAIRELMTPPTADEVREMGFHTILKTTPPAKSKG